MWWIHDGCGLGFIRRKMRAKSKLVLMNSFLDKVPYQGRHSYLGKALHQVWWLHLLLIRVFAAKI